MVGLAAVAIASSFTARQDDVSLASGECWFSRESQGLHFQVGGWYRGLPALCTSETISAH